jgi:hypothetical protein
LVPVGTKTFILINRGPPKEVRRSVILFEKC